MLMELWQDPELQADYQRCFDEIQRAVQQLGGTVTSEQLHVMAELIIQGMTGPWRYFHTPEHIFEVGASGDAIEVLAALFHDLVYYQVDQGVSVNISRYVAPFVKEMNGQLEILQSGQLLPDPLFQLVSAIFGFVPGQKLIPTAGQNEFLSAVIATRCLNPCLSGSIVAQIAACIEATIPFRPIGPTGKTAGDQLYDRLIGVNQQFGFEWSETDLQAIVTRAIRLANRDIENFAYESSAEFLDNTWNLLPETNHDLTSTNTYTVSGYRISLQKMEGFMNFLKPELVFQRYQNEPDLATYDCLIQRTGKNLAVARLYLGCKLLSISVIEALSLRIGKDIPLATMMGELPFRGISPAQQLETYLPDMPAVVPPQTSIEQEVLDLLEKGRIKSSTYDVKNSPTATYIVKSIGFEAARELLAHAKEFFKGNLLAEEYLAFCDPQVIYTIVQGVMQVLEHRKIAMGKIEIPHHV